MSDNRRATQFEDLPEEIVVDQILIRLPSKDVGRCRAVRTSWRSATSTPQFMLEHRRRQPLLPIIDGDGKPSSYVVYRDTGAGQSSQQLGAGASSQQIWPYILGEKKIGGHGLFAACDGFLIVSQQERFYICNPVIRKRALLVLPLSVRGQGSFNSVISFYRHNPTGEYRVLWLSAVDNYPRYCLHSLTVGSNESRHVTVTMPAVLPPSLEQNFLKELFLKFTSPPVHHRGNLHWCRGGANDITEGGGDIIVFDTEAESFRWMHSPAQLYSERRLFNMKGVLAFWGTSIPDSTAIDVWVMQDYEAEIWDFKYRIDVSTVEASRRLYKISLKNKRKKKTPLDSAVEWFNDMTVLNEGELLIHFNGKNVLRCDSDGKFLGIVHLGKSQYCMQLTQHRFQESIVPIP